MFLPFLTDETVTEARIAGRNLVHEIRDCKTWNMICVDPEHLREKAWQQISAFDVFRANIVYGCADEAHLINTWGTEFRPQLGHIGAAAQLREGADAGDARADSDGQRARRRGEAVDATLHPGDPVLAPGAGARWHWRTQRTSHACAPCDVARVFAQFERNRRPRVEHVRALARGTGGVKGGTAAGWKYTLKKWGMAAYFAWNVYKLRDERISGYDVTKQEVGVGVA
ncbi:hypothetical protein B0H14DRAFT_2653235 [Mycena olivaceomarginata]|nr:hypothetical protein B0H14DRAFT_2653235 [Mycena olivaceomarginata]